MARRAADAASTSRSGQLRKDARKLKQVGDVLEGVVAGARTTTDGRPVVGAAVSFSALLVLVLRFCRCLLLGAFLGVLPCTQSLRFVLLLGLFLVDDLREELLHLLGHAGG